MKACLDVEPAGRLIVLVVNTSSLFTSCATSQRATDLGDASPSESTVLICEVPSLFERLFHCGCLCNDYIYPCLAERMPGPLVSHVIRCQ